MIIHVLEEVWRRHPQSVSLSKNISYETIVSFQCIASERSAYWTHPLLDNEESFLRPRNTLMVKHVWLHAFAISTMLTNASFLIKDKGNATEIEIILFLFPKPLPKPSPSIKQLLSHECQGPPSNNLLQPPAKHTSLMIFLFLFFDYFFLSLSIFV